MVNLSNHSIPVITIDGPSGCGKGTIAERLAKKLHWHFLDSGALYRTIAWLVIQKKLDITDQTAILNLIKLSCIDIAAESRKESGKIIVDHQDITEDIRSENCGQMASKISMLPYVREALLNKQREMRQQPGLIADGRDMGTVVFPDAVLKFYFDASLEERAKRRFNQLKDKGKCVSLPDVTRELRLRDDRDSNRSISPSKPAADAVPIDTTHLTVEAVFQLVLYYVYKAIG